MPRKRVAADCLLTDESGRLLVLKPPYKPTWDLPGGIVEPDESPRDAARREVREELGLHVEPGQLLVVDWVPRTGDFTEIVAFLFDGGVLTDDDIQQIAAQETEVSTFTFVDLTEAEHLLDREQFARVTAGFARRRQATGATYLENGDQVSYPRPSHGS